MPRFKVEFARTITQWHEQVVEAEDGAAVLKMYEDGALADSPVDEKIIDEVGPTITAVTDA